MEAELIDELSKQQVLRKERELIELHANREARALQEERERESKGEHEVSMEARSLRIVPKFLYKTRAAQLRLNTLQFLNISNNKLVSLPESGCFFHMASLKKLDVSHNRLQYLPAEISDCTELFILDAQDNDIVELPKELSIKCIQLRKMNLCENELLRLPDDIGNLAKMESLLLFRNKLQSLPESLGLLDSLHTLDVSLNQLTSLPYSIGGCTQLTSLNISWNRVEVIPQGLGIGLGKLLTLNASNNIVHFLPSDMSGLTSLESFDMTHNDLISLPESMPKMTNLKTLNISNNRINLLPASFGDMRFMKTVLMRNNMIEAIPPTIGYLRRLEVLDFAKNQVKELPTEIGALLSLTHIDGSFNAISGCWPEELGCVPNLRSCIFTNNQIAELPYTIGGLTTLTMMNFSNNNISHVPESIGNMLSLTNLNLSCNRLASLPERIGDAQALQHIDLSANQLVAMPRTIGWLRCIRTLSVYNNKLRSLPAEFGTLIQRLESFSCGRNKFSDLKDKWSTTWTEKDKYRTIFTSGYTEGEAADWALEAQAWYPDAYEVWEKIFKSKWDRADLSEFMRVVRIKLGDDWRTRFEPKVRAFYFQAKHHLGYAPRYDQLSPSEQTEKRDSMEKAAAWHAEKIPKLRKEAREVRVRKQTSYLFDEREVIRRMKEYEKNKATREENQKQEWLRGLRELSKVLYDRQEHRKRKREFARQQAKLREQRLLKTAARARALRASRKAHATGLGGEQAISGKSMGHFDTDTDEDGLPPPRILGTR